MVEADPAHALSPSLSIQSYPSGLYALLPPGYRRQVLLLRPIAHMTTLTPLTTLTNPLGGQVIELQQLDYDSGGISLLRTRIREKSRFTIFEVDPMTARQWGEALIQWADGQPVEAVQPAESVSLSRLWRTG